MHARGDVSDGASKMLQLTTSNLAADMQHRDAITEFSQCLEMLLCLSAVTGLCDVEAVNVLYEN